MTPEERAEAERNFENGMLEPRDLFDWIDGAEAERDRLAAQVAAVTDLVTDARRAVAQTATCRCPDEPHQNLLHDIVHDLAALDDPAALLRERDAAVWDEGYEAGVNHEIEVRDHIEATDTNWTGRPPANPYRQEADRG